jgi:hypothetical protein
MWVMRLLLIFGLLLAGSAIALGLTHPNPGIYAAIPTAFIVLISAFRLRRIPTR